MRLHEGHSNSNHRQFSLSRNDDKHGILRSWHLTVAMITRNPSLRIYVNFKFSFKQEPYLHIIKEQKYRIASSRLRASSHTLEIERGRHDRPKKPVDARLCSCSVIEDERHFVCQCSINWEIRVHMCSKVKEISLDFAHLSDEDKFVFLMTNNDHRIINWLGKFVYQSCQIRDRLSSIVHT